MPPRIPRRLRYRVIFSEAEVAHNDAHAERRQVLALSTFDGSPPPPVFRMSNPPLRRRWPYVLLALAATAGALFGFSGYMMAGSASAATTWPPPPGHVAHWQRVAYGYLALWLGSLLALVASAVVLWSRRSRDEGSDAL